MSAWATGSWATGAWATGAWSVDGSASLNLAATESPDVAALSLRLMGSLALSATEAPDTMAFEVTGAGSTGAWAVGAWATGAWAVGAWSVGAEPAGRTLTLAATEAQDTAAFALVGVRSLSLAATEAADTASIALVRERELSLAATEAPDVVSLTLDNSVDAYTPPVYGGFTRVSKRDKKLAQDWLDRMIAQALRNPEKPGSKVVEIDPLSDPPEHLKFVTFKPNRDIRRPPLKFQTFTAKPAKTKAPRVSAAAEVEAQAAEVVRQELARIAKINRRRKRDEELLLFM
jgi:hypothetical protein